MSEHKQLRVEFLNSDVCVYLVHCNTSQLELIKILLVASVLLHVLWMLLDSDPCCTEPSAWSDLCIKNKSKIGHSQPSEDSATAKISQMSKMGIKSKYYQQYKTDFQIMLMYDGKRYQTRILSRLIFIQKYTKQIIYQNNHVWPIQAWKVLISGADVLPSTCQEQRIKLLNYPSSNAW